MTAAILMSSALIFGLIASPLIVECIPRDGRALVELLGQDPCHHLGTYLALERHLPAAMNEDDPDDPCLDLVLDNLGLTQSAVAIQGPLHGASLSCVLPACTESSVQPWNVVRAGRLAREPVSPEETDPLLAVSLRI